LVENILPYHHIASGTYEKLELEYNRGEMDETSEEEIYQAIELFLSYGIESEVGG